MCPGRKYLSKQKEKETFPCSLCVFSLKWNGICFQFITWNRCKIRRPQNTCSTLEQHSRVSSRKSVTGSLPSYVLYPVFLSNTTTQKSQYSYWIFQDWKLWLVLFPVITIFVCLVLLLLLSKPSNRSNILTLQPGIRGVCLWKKFLGQKRFFLLYCLYNFSHSETKISVTRLSKIPLLFFKL